MKQKDSAVGMACGLAIGMTCGLVLGAVAGVLLAPATGAETRRRLRYEKDNAVEAARLQAQRTMARLRREGAEEVVGGEDVREGGEEMAEEEEHEGAFCGA